jgi:hypothetical protein
MPSHHFSASKTALAEHCLYSFRADVPRPPKRPQRRDALVGTALHYAIEQTIRTGDKETKLPDWDEEDRILTADEKLHVVQSHETWVGEWWAKHSHEKWVSEIAAGYDPFARQTVHLVGSDHRDYRLLGDTYVPGTVDAAYYSIDSEGNGTLYMTDWKSGFGSIDSCAPASENGQLASLSVIQANGSQYAVFPYPLTQLKRVVVSIVRISPHSLKEDTAELDAFDLAEHRENLKAILLGIPGSQPVPGPHCRDNFCDQFGSCPATAGALAEVVPETDGLVGSVALEKRRLPIVLASSEIQDAEHAAYQYRTLREAQAVIETRMAAAWNAIREWADGNGGVPIDESTVWQRRVSPRESIDLTVVGATNALEHALGDRWRTAVEMSTTKAAIETAVRPLVTAHNAALENGTKKLTIRAMKDSVLDGLRTVGAVKVSQRVSYEECKVEKNDG